MGNRPLSRFIGREAELRLVTDRLASTERGQGQVIGIVGEPGVGKSRFVYELTRINATHGWRVLGCGGVSHGSTTPFLPLSDLLRRYFAIEDADEPDVIREKVTETVLSRQEELTSHLAPLLSLLDIPLDDPSWRELDAPQRGQQIRDAIRRLLLNESRIQPLLLIVEDLHWLDAETRALLDSLVDSLPRARVILLATYRPEYQQTWSHKTYYTQVRIDPLPAETARTFLGWLIGGHEALDPLKRLLIERTEGNPLFLEESVRTLVESKALEGDPGAYRAARAVEVVEVPATVETILAARIDRLRPDDRRLLQSAAVIGRDVPFALLRAIADHDEDILREGLGRLRATEFLYETRIHPDLEYTFKHALTHDVAYGSLLEERRRALHAGVVDAIERLYADRLAEHVERLAEHAWRGGLAERAVSYLRQAGLKASARSARDALARFEEALRILDAMPESAFTLEQGFGIRLELRQVLAQLGDFLTARERLREAEALAERLDDDRHRGRVGSVMTNIHNNLGELDEALASGTRALEVAERLGDSSLRVLTTTYLEQAHYYRGDYERAIELAIDNLAALPADRIADLLGPASVYDRIYLILSLAALGRFAEAAAHEAHVIRLAGLTQHAFTVGAAYCSAATLHLFRGHWVTARPLVEHAVAVCRNGSVVALLPYAVALSAWVLAQLGEASEALHRIQEGGQGLDGLAARGRILLGWEYHTLGRASLLLGQLDEARRLADRAVDLSRRQPGFAAHALRLLGDIATDHHRFDAERGEAHYRQALALAEPRGMRPVVAHCHLGLGKLYRRTGQREQAQEHLTSATAMYREMDMRFWLEQAETETKDWHENHSAPSPSSA